MTDATDMLIARLRGRAAQEERNHNLTAANLLREAAAEIQRLENEVERLEDEVAEGWELAMDDMKEQR